MSRRLPAAGWILSLIVATGTLLAYGYAEGVWAGRWQPSDASRRAAERLKDVPLVIGSWASEEGEFDDRQLALAELDGVLYRVYTDRTTGQSVQLLVVCGRPGPVSVHTPDVCYRGLGYSTTLPPARQILTQDDEGRELTCWAADFQKPTPGGKEFLRIAWTWLGDGQWRAADQPRFEYAREPYLFKAYLLHPVMSARSDWTDDAIPSLAKELMPVLTRTLGSGPERDAPAERS